MATTALARIAGVTIPANKQIAVSLTSIYGIGLFQAHKILAEAKIESNVKTHQLSSEQVNTLRDIIEKKYRVEGELKRERLTSIKRLKEINSYRGSRHAKGLPVRGQRSRTNTRTVRGNVRRTMGSGRKSAAEKT